MSFNWGSEHTNYHIYSHTNLSNNIYRDNNAITIGHICML